jgi:outer membrane lipoprotein LolB
MPRPRFESLRLRAVASPSPCVALPARRCRRAPAEASDVLSGRLALRVEPLANEAPRSVSAAFDLRGDSRAGTLGLSTPLGSMLAQARWSPAEVVLTTPRETRRFASLDELTREALGESVPIEAWFDWLRGRPVARSAERAPGCAPTAPSDPPAPGFRQLGWRVDLSQFAPARSRRRAKRPRRS